MRSGEMVSLVTWSEPAASFVWSVSWRSVEDPHESQLNLSRSLGVC